MSELLTEITRPTGLDEVKGQDHIIPQLKAKIESKNMRPMIFYGPSGVGKTSTAIAFANDLCGIENFDTDVMQITSSVDSGVDHAKSLTVKTAYTTVSGYRVIIMDEAHGLTPQAFESLLTTLELSNNTVFILVTTKHWVIPSTIQSRCISFQFNSFKPEYIAESLTAIAKENSIDISDSDIKKLALFSKGNMRNAVKYLETYSMSESVDHIIRAYDHALQLLTLVMEDDYQAALIFVESYDNDWYELFNSLCDHFNALLLDMGMSDGYKDDLDNIRYVLHLHQCLLEADSKPKYTGKTTFVHWLCGVMIYE